MIISKTKTILEVIARIRAKIVSLLLYLLDFSTNFGILANFFSQLDLLKNWYKGFVKYKILKLFQKKW